MKWESFEELKLASQKSWADAISSATIKAEFASLAQLKHKVPMENQGP